MSVSTITNTSIRRNGMTVVACIRFSGCELSDSSALAALTSARYAKRSGAVNNQSGTSKAKEAGGGG